MANEITTTASKSFLPVPTNFDEAWRISQIMADSDMVPKEFKGKPGNCLIAMQWGSEIGMPGIQALQNIAVINNRPSIWGDAAKALVIGRPDCEDITEFFEGENENLTAVCIVKRKGKSPVTAKFSVADAKAAGLWGKPGPWQQYKKRMLQMRARSFGLRDSFPDALKGLLIAEEAQDFPSEKEINPVQQSSSETYKEEAKSFNDILESIKFMSVSEFKTIKGDFSAEEKKQLNKAMTERKAEIMASQKNSVVDTVEQDDWTSRIKRCGDTFTLNELLKTMPKDEVNENADLIDQIRFELGE